jgi:pimeloyl-ACP methyl ester carboxylesterase
LVDPNDVVYPENETSAWPIGLGFSMGGAIAQLLPLDHASRVAWLTLISTSPGTGADLPGMADELRAYFAEPRP